MLYKCGKSVIDLEFVSADIVASFKSRFLFFSVGD